MDKEIIKAVEICKKTHLVEDCSECSYAGEYIACLSEVMTSAIDFIRRYGDDKIMQRYYKAGIKDFTKRLKEEETLTKEDIDNLVKEMVGDTE
ncbi:MAG: hypothetical protein ACI4J7_00305 [Ruminiclostridium sp.]